MQCLPSIRHSQLQELTQKRGRLNKSANENNIWGRWGKWTINEITKRAGTRHEIEEHMVNRNKNDRSQVFTPKMTWMQTEVSRSIPYTPTQKRQESIQPRRITPICVLNQAQSTKTWVSGLCHHIYQTKVTRQWQGTAWFVLPLLHSMSNLRAPLASSFLITELPRGYGRSALNTTPFSGKLIWFISFCYQQCSHVHVNVAANILLRIS